MLAWGPSWWWIVAPNVRLGLNEAAGHVAVGAERDLLPPIHSRYTCRNFPLRGCRAGGSAAFSITTAAAPC